MQKKNKTSLELWLPNDKEPIVQPFFGLDRTGTPKRFKVKRKRKVRLVRKLIKKIKKWMKN